MLSISVELSKKTSKYTTGFATDVRNYTLQELRKICNKEFSKANHRIQALKNSKVPSDALRAVEQSGGKFSSRGKDLNQLQKEYSRCIRFLQMKTSTVTGAKARIKLIEKKYGFKFSDKLMKRVFETYRKIEKMSPIGAKIYGSENLIQQIINECHEDSFDVDEGESWSKAVDRIIKELDQKQMEVISEFESAFTDAFTPKRY